MALNFLKPKITFYEKPDEMPLWNFQKYLETQDLKYFTIEHKFHKDLDDIMTKFFGYYINLSKNQQVLNRFGIMHDIIRYQSKYNSVCLIIKALYNYPKDIPIDKFNELIEQLKKWNYKISKEKDIFDQIESIYNRVQGIKTKIELLKSEIVDEDKTTIKNIESQLIYVERVLELGYKLKPKEITVLDWIEYQKQAEETIKSKE